MAIMRNRKIVNRLIVRLLATLLVAGFLTGFPISSASSAIVSSGLLLNLDGSVSSSYNGTTWTDQSGNGRNATQVNSPTYNSIDGSFTLNGTNQYFNLGNILSLTSEFSVEVTFMPNSISGTPALVARQNTAVAGNYFVGISSSKANYYVESTPWGLTSSTTLTVGSKYTATLVYDASKAITPYLNGVQDGTKTTFSNTLYSNSINLQIGAMLTSSSASNFFSGKIYSVRIYNRALSSSEVSQNYNSNTVGVLQFSNSNGTFNAWNQGAGSIYLNKITGVAGVVITSIKSGWASNISTQASSNTVYLFTDVSGAPGSVAATFTYSSNDGANWATYVGSYTVPAGRTFFVGQRATTFINNAGGSTSNQAGTTWSITYANRYSGTSLTGPFTNDAIGSSPIWQIYGETVDTTAPSFTSSSSFSAAENIAITSAAATIKVSESATVTISSGADAALFTISNSDTVTALIKFKVSPNYEAPSDSGGNNVYDLVLTATDSASNSGTQTITITVTDVVDTSSFNSFSLSATPAYRTVVTITANVSVAAKVTFRAKNVIISGCKNKLANGSGSSFSATCSWRPSVRGAVVLTATAAPTGGGISSATATPLSVMVGNRSGRR
jgi:hypothetical protein